MHTSQDYFDLYCYGLNRDEIPEEGIVRIGSSRVSHHRLSWIDLRLLQESQHHHCVKTCFPAVHKDWHFLCFLRTLSHCWLKCNHVWNVLHFQRASTCFQRIASGSVKFAACHWSPSSYCTESPKLRDYGKEALLTIECLSWDEAKRPNTSKILH
jgi:hypothetical protein